MTPTMHAVVRASKVLQPQADGIPEFLRLWIGVTEL